MPQTYDYWDDPSQNMFQAPQGEKPPVQNPQQASQSQQVLEGQGDQQPEAQPQVQPQMQPQVELQPQAEPQAQARPQVEPKVEPQPQMQQQRQVEPEAQMHPQAESQTQARDEQRSQPQQVSHKQAPARSKSWPQASPGAGFAPGPSAAPSYQQAPQVAYVPVQQLPQKKSYGWIVGIVLVICLFAFAAFCVKSCTDVVANTGAYGASVGPAPNSIAVIDLDGTIQYDGTACSPEGLKSLLDKAAGNDNIKGVVLRVNSGGGTATAGEEMADYVRDFKKPIVVSSASINASAAYEISSQANYIYVAKSSEIGSIGTAMELTDISGLLNMLGVDVDVISSSGSKDSTYGYRPLTNEEREYYQRMINQINDIFIENVAAGRAMPVENVRELANGLVYTGVDAVDNGLADEVGTLEDAVAKTAELAGLKDYETYDLALGSYDISSLYYLLGGSGQESSQLSAPTLKQ